MKMHLSREQMLSLWRLFRLLEPIRSDVAVSRSDGIDLDSILLAEMELWYKKLLLNSPPHLLVAHDVASEVTLSSAPGGALVVTLPEGTFRVLSVKLSDWESAAEIVAHDSPEARCQLNPYSRAVPSSPVAVLSGDRLTLYPATSGSVLQELNCVIYTEGEYEFMREALATITPLDPSVLTPLTFNP